MDPNEVITDFTLLEYPFMHEGITHGEFDEEKIYFAQHYDDYRKGNYTPLWKQRKKED